MALKFNPHVLIVEARFYTELADEQARGATVALEAAGATYERVNVPGALELPTALSLAIEAGRFSETGNQDHFHGCVALGCVIRGDTYHFELVANESVHWLMQLAAAHHIPLGNGILTVDTSEQAWSRAKGGEESKGADAARACLRLIELHQDFHSRIKLKTGAAA